MTAINCGNCAIAEVRINGVVHSRRNCHWQAMVSCYDPGIPFNCVCDGIVPANAADYALIMHKKWVELPAGPNTIEVYGIRIGRSAIESQIEAAVWRKTCPPIEANVTCIPAEVIVEQGLCEFERLAALYGAMVGCLEVSGQCSQGPDVYQDGPTCLNLPCAPETVGECDGCEPNDPPNPLGGVLMNTININYPYITRVQIEWETAFVQDFVDQCDCNPGP